MKSYVYVVSFTHWKKNNFSILRYKKFLKVHILAVILHVVIPTPCSDVEYFYSYLYTRYILTAMILVNKFS